MLVLVLVVVVVLVLGGGGGGGGLRLSDPQRPYVDLREKNS